MTSIFRSDGVERQNIGGHETAGFEFKNMLFSASQTVPTIHVRGIRLGKAEEFINSNSDETEATSALIEWAPCDFSGRSAGKIVHFSFQFSPLQGRAELFWDPFVSSTRSRSYAQAGTEVLLLVDG